MQDLEVSEVSIELLAYATGKELQRDPKTERLTLVHEGVRYWSQPQPQDEA